MILTRGRYFQKYLKIGRWGSRVTIKRGTSFRNSLKRGVGNKR